MAKKPSPRRLVLAVAALLACSPAVANEPSELTLLPAEEIAAPQDSIQPSELPLDAPLMAEPLEIEPLEDGPIIQVAPDGPAPVFDDNNSIVRTFGYNTTHSNTTWLPASDDEFGWVSLESHGALEMGTPGGIVGGIGFHFLDGPIRTEMPPRLFDFSIGYQRREWIRPNFGWDFLFRVGAFSDFEGSADDGIRFPSNAVTFLRVGPTTTWLLGVDYLDWDDINLLPVLGIVWTPTDHFRLDLAFPRPRAAVRIMNSHSWLYVAGELAGGTWAIERNDQWNDNVTYHDLRLVFGIETWTDNCVSSGLELGYVFDRELSYRSGVGDYSPRECLMVRLVGRY
ncbi:MAG: hypothetical protein WD851_18445 [Pirellulales bacterium]